MSRQIDRYRNQSSEISRTLRTDDHFIIVRDGVEYVMSYRDLLNLANDSVNNSAGDSAGDSAGGGIDISSLIEADQPYDTTDRVIVLQDGVIKKGVIPMGMTIFSFGGLSLAVSMGSIIASSSSASTTVLFSSGALTL